MVHDVIVLFGDSITQAGWTEGGFGQRLSEVYARKLDVLNRGYAGYNTEWAIPVLEQCLPRKTVSGGQVVRILTIWLGANDACLHQSPQNVPLPRYRANLKQMVQMVVSPDSEWYSPSTKIILMTPPPCNTVQRKAALQLRVPPIELDRTFENTKAYADTVKEVGSEQGVAVADVWSALWEACGKREDGLSKYLSDGLHLTREGYKVVFELLLEVLAERHPELQPDRLESVFPLWADIDWKDPRPSLQARAAVH